MDASALKSHLLNAPRLPFTPAQLDLRIGTDWVGDQAVYIEVATEESVPRGKASEFLSWAWDVVQAQPGYETYPVYSFFTLTSDLAPAKA